MITDDEIRNFVRFMNDHEEQALRYDPETGLLLSSGCRGDFKCCVESFDLDSLKDVLAELIST